MHEYIGTLEIATLDKVMLPFNSCAIQFGAANCGVIDQSVRNVTQAEQIQLCFARHPQSASSHRVLASSAIYR